MSDTAGKYGNMQPTQPVHGAKVCAKKEKKNQVECKLQRLLG
jgi:hypothetical protein